MLNNEYPPLGGGTGTVNQAILNGFVDHTDISIDLVTGCSVPKRNIVQISDRIRIIYIPLKSKNIHHASNYELVKYSILATFKAYQLHKKNKYDFSFSWSTVPAGFVSYVMKLLFGLPFVIRVGGPDIPGFEERYRNIYKIISPIIKLIWRNSVLIVAKCFTEKQMVLKIEPRLKVRIIYNGVDLSTFKPNTGIRNIPLRIICSARLIKRKGQDLLIEALGKLKEKGIFFYLDLIGDGDEKQNYIALAKRLNVIDQIEFKGYVPRELMVGAYHLADIFVLPSYNEGMSNALLEAMACGLTPVVTDVGGTSELVNEERNGFVFKAGNSEQLTSILEKIANQPDILDRMGRSSSQLVKQLNWPQVVREYLSVFNEMTKKLK